MSLTSDLAGPLSIYITFSFFIPIPAISVSLMWVILSPALSPAFSEGPSFVVLITSRVSLKILNCIPTPSKFPPSSSCILLESLALIYIVCGSSASKSFGIVSSIISSFVILSTYSFAIKSSIKLNLSFFCGIRIIPAPLFLLNISAINIPASIDVAIITGNKIAYLELLYSLIFFKITNFYICSFQ